MELLRQQVFNNAQQQADRLALNQPKLASNDSSEEAKPNQAAEPQSANAAAGATPPDDPPIPPTPPNPASVQIQAGGDLLSQLRKTIGTEEHPLDLVEFYQIRGLHPDYRDFSNVVFQRGMGFAPGDDLSGFDFSNAYLENAVFGERCKGENIKFAGADLKRAIFKEGFNFNVVDFKGADISYISFANGGLTRANFAGANAYRAGLHNVTFRNSYFGGENFEEASFANGDFHQCIFEDINLQKANLSNTDSFSSEFVNVDLRKASLVQFRTFGNTAFKKVDLSNALIKDFNWRSWNSMRPNAEKAAYEKGFFLVTLDGARISNVRFPKPISIEVCKEITRDDFTNANLRGTNILSLTEYVSNPKFTNSNLSDALIEACDFREASFRNASLFNAKFDDCTLTRCDFVNTNLHETTFDDCRLGYCNFDRANLLFTSFLPSSSFGEHHSLIQRSSFNNARVDLDVIDSPLITYIANNPHLCTDLRLVGFLELANSLERETPGNFARFTVLTRLQHILDNNLSNINLFSSRMGYLDSRLIGSNQNSEFIQDIPEANFTDSNLTDTDLNSCNLSHATFANTNMHNADLRGASLEGSDLYELNFADFNWDISTDLTRVINAPDGVLRSLPAEKRARAISRSNKQY